MDRLDDDDDGMTVYWELLASEQPLSEDFDDDGDGDGDGDGDADLVARVSEFYQQERALIRSTSNLATLQQMRDMYARELEGEGLPAVAAMRASDLLEQIDDRLADLEFDSAQQAFAARAAQRSLQSGKSQPQPLAPLLAVQIEERAAAVRLANAQAAEIEARTALLRAQAAQLAAAGSCAPGTAPTPVAPPSIVPGPARKLGDFRQGKADAAQPRGGDLRAFREGQQLSQRQAAERLGVAHGTVAKAELAPDKVLSEPLARALQTARQR